MIAAGESVKIAFIAIRGKDWGGGFTTYIEKIGGELTRRGHDVTVYASRHYGSVDGDYLGKYRVVTVPSINTKHLLRLSLALSASVRQMFCRYDLAHYLLVETSLFALLAKWTGKKVVVQSHGIDHRRAKWGKGTAAGMRLLERLSFGVGDALTVVSPDIRKYYLDTYGKETVFIPPAVEIPDSVPPKIITEAYGLSGGDYYLYLGRMVPEKQADTLIRAYQTLKTDKKLILAGDDTGTDSYVRSLKALAEGDDRIRFTGLVIGKLKEELFSNAFAFVLPSALEGLAATMLEAMSYHTCCLVSDISENLYVARDRAFVFRCGDAEDCARAMMDMERNPQTCRHYADKAFRHVCDQYTLGKVVDQIEALYETVVRKQD